MALKGVWKSALEEHGALSVMISGIALMLKLRVTSWALHKQVCVFMVHCISNIKFSWYTQELLLFTHSLVALEPFTWTIFVVLEVNPD